MKIRDDVQYRHFRTKNKGAVTVAYQTSQTGNVVSVGFAWCSPRDQFSRPKGRLISKGRLYSDIASVVRFSEKDSIENVPLHEVVFNRIIDAGKTPCIPNWFSAFRKAYILESSIKADRLKNYQELQKLVNENPDLQCVGILESFMDDLWYEMSDKEHKILNSEKY